jgi:hypothetical protein
MTISIRPSNSVDSCLISKTIVVESSTFFVREQQKLAGLPDI